MRLLLFVLLGWILLSLPLAMLIGRYLRGLPAPRCRESRAHDRHAVAREAHDVRSHETVGEERLGRPSEQTVEPVDSGGKGWPLSPARDHEHTPELVKRLRSAGWHELDPGRTA